MSSRLRGYLSIFAAAFFWGSSATAAKFLFQHNISPMLVVQSRVIFAALFLAAVLLFLDKRLLKISPKDLLDFGLLGVFGVAGANYTYYMAIQVTNVGIAILMQYTAPVLVAIYMLISRQEKISRIKTLAIVLSLGGSAVMLGAFSPDVHITALGILFGVASAVCFAFFNVYNKVASKRYSIWTAVTWTLICAGLFWIVVDVVTASELSQVSYRELATLTGFSLISVLIPYYFYFSGLKRLAASTAIIVSTLEPVVAISTSFLFLGEKMEVFQIAGGIFVVSAVVLLEVFRE